MTYAEFSAIQVVADVTAALALNPTQKGGGRTQFVFADSPDGTKNSQQNLTVNIPSRVVYFERLPQEKCCGTFGKVTSPQVSPSRGLDHVYPSPRYPGYGGLGYVAIHETLEV